MSVIYETSTYRGSSPRNRATRKPGLSHKVSRKHGRLLYCRELLISRRLVATSVERQAGSIIFSVRVREGECPPHEITMATPTRPATASCPACFHVLLAWRLLTSQSPQAKNDNSRLSCRQLASTIGALTFKSR